LNQLQNSSLRLFFLNHGTLTGGVFYNTNDDGYANATLNYNQFVTNTVTEVYAFNGQVNVDNNWWGINFNGNDSQSAGMTNFKVNTWMNSS